MAAGIPKKTLFSASSSDSNEDNPALNQLSKYAQSKKYTFPAKTLINKHCTSSSDEEYCKVSCKKQNTKQIDVQPIPAQKNKIQQMTYCNKQKKFMFKNQCDTQKTLSFSNETSQIPPLNTINVQSPKILNSINNEEAAPSNSIKIEKQLNSYLNFYKTNPNPSIAVKKKNLFDSSDDDIIKPAAPPSHPHKPINESAAAVPKKNKIFDDSDED